MLQCPVENVNDETTGKMGTAFPGYRGLPMVQTGLLCDFTCPGISIQDFIRVEVKTYP